MRHTHSSLTRIRRARLEDAAAIGRVEVDSWQASYLAILPAEYLNAMSISRHAASWASTLVAGGRVWVADVDGAVVGFASVGQARDKSAGKRTGEIYAIYLAPFAWGRGLGSALLDAAEADLESNGDRVSIIWVLTANTRARRFYELAGYVDDGSRRPVHLGAWVDTARYRKPI